MACVKKIFFFDGLTRFCLRVEEDALFLSVRSLSKSYDKKIHYSELSPDYAIVKTGIRGGFTFVYYALVFGVLFGLIADHFYDVLLLRGASILILALGLVIFIISHVKIFESAQFYFTNGQGAFPLDIRKDRPEIDYICRKIKSAKKGSMNLRIKSFVGSVLKVLQKERVMVFPV